MIGAAGADDDAGIRRREADGVGEQIVQHLHDAALVADEGADIGIDRDGQADAVGGEPVLHALGGGLDRLGGIDWPELELHGAGIDGGEVENVVGQRQQRVGRFGDVVEIFGLLRRQRPVEGVGQEMARSR